jgi:predicted ArsR family transcriptional regulator
MPSRYEKEVLRILAQDPVTPSEVANSLGISYKTAQKTLLDLAASREDVGYKKSGRIYLFWHRQDTRRTKSEG